MKYFTLILVVFVFGCGGGRKEQKIPVPEPQSLLDSSYLFDGKTLNSWEVTNFGPQGPVAVSDGSIILGMGDGCTGITYKKDFPAMNYEVMLEAKRIAGSDFFCGMTFPVGKDPCTLIIGGWGGTVVGLSSINGKDASENETSRLMKFDMDRWYTIKLRVTEKNINVWIDNENVVNFTIGKSKLTIRPEVNLSRPFGIASWNTTAALRNIRVKPLN